MNKGTVKFFNDTKGFGFISEEGAGKETLQEDSNEPLHWQWIKGDDIGNVVTIKSEDDKWINFNNGTRLAKDLKSEFIKQLDSDIAGELLKTQSSIAMTPSTAVQKVSVDIPIPALDTTPSPIRVLFNKQKKNNKVKLLLEFPVNIPAKGVYELMSASFDPTEVNEELHDFILDQLSQDEITDCLFDSIKSLIESKDKGEEHT